MSQRGRRDVARNADRLAADHRFAKADRFAIRTQETILTRRRRGNFTAVDSAGLGHSGVEMNEEAAAAYPRRLRLDDAQRKHGRDRGVGSASAGAEHLDTCLSRAGIGRGDSAALRHRGDGKQEQQRSKNTYHHRLVARLVRQ